MMISTKGRYALRIMVDVAQHDGEMPVSVREIAQRQDISGKYMEQIISVLTRSGLLRSIRGAQGGYHLAKSPEQITVGMILRATEGDLAPAECVSVDGHACTRSGVCPSHAVFSKVYSAINSVIDGVTLCDLSRRAKAFRRGTRAHACNAESTHGMNDNIDGREFFVIYMDNAATTRLSGRALEAMMPYLTEQYANPAGTYSFTHASNAAMEKARKQVADVIGATSAEIFFTSGGTESDNWALKGTMRANEKKGRHLIISAIEHHAILHSAKALEREGFEVTVLPVDADGVVAPEAVEAAIRPDTVLVSIMAANNEIGTIEPLEAIGAVCKRHGVIFHTDAVQAFGHIPLNVEQMHIDLLSVSAHKFHGPKGVGFLYIRKGVKLVPFMDGGAQEKNRRAGTSNVPGIVGMGEAAQLAAENMETAMAKVAAVRDHLIARIEAEIPYAKLNGHRTNRLPGNVNFCFRFIEGESMLMLLDAQGVCASSGSACTSGSLDPSHVLLAIGCPHEIAHGSLRLSLSEETTMADADFVVDQLKEIIPRLRSMSPLYADFIAKK